MQAKTLIFTPSATDLRECFLLRRFLPCTPSYYFQGFPGAGSSTSKSAGLHVNLRNIAQPNYLFESQQSTKDLYVIGSIKG